MLPLPIQINLLTMATKNGGAVSVFSGCVVLGLVFGVLGFVVYTISF